MKIKLECPYARYNAEMRIMCDKLKGLCGHQRYRPCKGWCVLSDGAAGCTARKDKA